MKNSVFARGFVETCRAGEVTEGIFIHPSVPSNFRISDGVKTIQITYSQDKVVNTMYLAFTIDKQARTIPSV